MRLLFVRSEGLASLGIRRFEGGESSHVGIALDDNTVIDATMKYGVTNRSFSSFMDNRTLVDDITFPLTNETNAINFAKSMIGATYDWTALVGFVGWRDLSRDDRWYCSELAAASMAAGGYQLADRTKRITVRLVREIAKALCS